MKKLSLEEIIQKCRDVHGDRYDYNLIENYERKSQNVNIICKIHGIFNQIIGNHIYHKAGCPKCGLRIRKKLKILF